MTEQDNDETFPTPRPIAECREDRALCWVPLPPEIPVTTGRWEILYRQDDNSWIKETGKPQHPSHFISLPPDIEPEGPRVTWDDLFDAIAEQHHLARREAFLSS